MNKTLDDYATKDQKAIKPKKEYKIKSVNKKHLDRVYPVELDPDHCPCTSFQRYNDCIHINKAKNIELMKHNEYLKERYERESTAIFDSMESALAHFNISKSEEVNYLSFLFLCILNKANGTTDDLYDAVRGKFQSDPRIVGSVSRMLLKREYIKNTGLKVISPRKKIHGDLQPVYRITEKGKQALMEMG